MVDPPPAGCFSLHEASETLDETAVVRYEGGAEVEGSEEEEGEVEIWRRRTGGKENQI